MQKGWILKKNSRKKFKTIAINYNQWIGSLFLPKETNNICNYPEFINRPEIKNLINLLQKKLVLKPLKQ